MPRPPSRARHHPPLGVRLRLRLRLAALSALLLAGCALPVIDEADQLARQGRYEAAYARLDDALRQQPDDAALRTAHSRQRDRVVVQALARADLALASSRLDEAERLVERVRALDARQPRLGTISAQLTQAAGRIRPPRRR